MWIVTRDAFLLLVVTAGLYSIYYIGYILSINDFTTNNKPISFLLPKILSEVPATVSNSTIKQPEKVFNSTINQQAINMSKQIIDHENALIRAGLLPKYNDHLEWFKPSGKTVDYGDGTCDESSNRKRYKDLMNKWKELSETYNIPYFLLSGSLLGAARNGDFIPWDGDMDILVPGRFSEVIAAIADERNFERHDGNFHLIIQKDFRKPFPYETNKLYPTEHRRRFDCIGKQEFETEFENDKCAFQEPLARLIKNGHHVDLYDYYYKDGYIYEPGGYQWPETMVFPLRKCMLMEIEMLCPQKINEFLTVLYGNDFMIPTSKCNNTLWISTWTIIILKASLILLLLWLLMMLLLCHKQLLPYLAGPISEQKAHHVIM